MRMIVVVTIALSMMQTPALALDIWSPLNETAPRSVFDQLNEAAPRSVFDQIRETAPRAPSRDGSDAETLIGE